MPPPSELAQPIPLHELLGLEFGPPDPEAKVSTVTMAVRPEAFGAGGTLHGGAIATMVDLACALAAVQATGFDHLTQSLVTTDMHIRYLGQPRTDRVLARAEVIRAGSQLVVVECKVSDDNGHLVAAADLSLMLVTRRRPLTPAESEPLAGSEGSGV